MYRVTFNLPRHYNNQQPIAPGKIREIEKRIIQVSGGLTRYNASGQWIENNKLFIDENYLYFTVTKKININKIKAILLYAKVLFQQESIYFEITKTEVEFI